VNGNQFVEVLLGVKDYVNLQAAQALAFDALDPASGVGDALRARRGAVGATRRPGRHDGRLSDSGDVQVRSNWHGATELGLQFLHSFIG
jgi:hypothetical protein